MNKRIPFLLFVFSIFSAGLKAQIPDNFVFGNDLSYVNQMEDCGAVYKENGVAKDPFMIFADHGTNLVRVRLWVDPSWWQSPLEQPGGVKPYYNDLEDVKETIGRAKAAGMQVMLGFHFSDFWADPGRQLIPRKWLNVAYDPEALKDSVYNYTTKVLTELDDQGLMPEYVKVGNENNAGILRHIPEEDGYEPAGSVSDSWARHAQLFNAAIAAIRDVGATASVNPKIALHFSNQLSGQVWNYNNIITNGVTDFDIIGISYYYSWHGGSIRELEKTIRDLKSTFSGYQVMVVETGYLWTKQNFDQLGNIITEPDPEYLPVSPAKQLEYMVDFTKAVMKGGGAGVVFWEPAWVSTPCRTPWGTGSSHDHVAFFDPDNTNFMESGGGRWTEPQWYQETVKVTFKADMTGQDDSEGVYISGDFTGGENWEILPMTSESTDLYFYTTYLMPGTSGAFYFLNGNDWDAREAVPDECAEWWGTDRGYLIPGQDVVYRYAWGTCEATPSVTSVDKAESESAADEVTIYPNPAKEFLQVDLKNFNIDSIAIQDVHGRVIRSYKMNSSVPFVLNIKKIEPGVYFISFAGGSQVILRKFMKE